MKTINILRKDTKRKPDRNGKKTALELAQELDISSSELASILQIPEGQQLEFFNSTNCSLKSNA